MEIRLFNPNDYPAIAGINNTFWTEEMLTAEQWQSDDANRAAHCKHARWVAEAEGRVIGMCEYDQLAGRYHPDKYWLRLEVMPDYQRRGIGAALYDALMNGLSLLNPWLIRFALRESMTDSLRFLRARGFAEEWRSYESHLDVTQFDFAPYADVEDKLRASGIVIKTYAELDPATRDQKLYAVHTLTRADTAFNEPLTEMTFEQWCKLFLAHHHANLDAFFVATRDGEYLGLAAMDTAQPGTNIDTRWNGVRRDARGSGVGTALRLRMIDYARRHQHPYLVTTTNSQNIPVIAMNRKMGYVDQPAWAYYSKTLREQP